MNEDELDEDSDDEMNSWEDMSEEDVEGWTDNITNSFDYNGFNE
jgi:hypothetical protein